MSDSPGHDGDDVDVDREEGVATAPPFVSRALRQAETVIYCLVSVVLFGASLVLLGEGAYDLATTVREDVSEAIKDALDTLLLVFIFVELLGATRETMTERKIVAEPFLLVGIIASIKEVVVLAIDAKEAVGKEGDVFEESMIGIATMTGLLLVLSIAILLVRRKEREPEE